MPDEIFELRSENIELKEIVEKLEGKNAELIEKIDKLKEENESLKAENSQLKNLPESNVFIQTSQSMEESNDFTPIIEKPKLKARFFKNWLLFDTLPWIDRKELANSSMSTANETFRQLCWPKLHGNVKPHKIQSLKISAAHFELGKFRAQVQLKSFGMCWRNEEIIPIASIPPLDYILGIEQIQINFVNDEVVNFFKSIENLLQKCKLEMRIYNTKQITSSTRTLMNYLATKIYLLRIGWRYNGRRLNYFNKFLPGFIDNIQFMRTWGTIPYIDELEEILNWLTKQSNNGKQKILEFTCHRDDNFMEFFNTRINEEFSNSTSPSIFMINFWTNQNLEEFIHENVQTNEILTLYRKDEMGSAGSDDDHNYYIARYPNGEEYWKEDGENKIREYQKTDNSSTSISIIIT